MWPHVCDNLLHRNSAIKNDKQVNSCTRMISLSGKSIVKINKSAFSNFLSTETVPEFSRLGCHYKAIKPMHFQLGGHCNTFTLRLFPGEKRPSGYWVLRSTVTSRGVLKSHTSKGVHLQQAKISSLKIFFLVVRSPEWLFSKCVGTK